MIVRAVILAASGIALAISARGSGPSPSLRAAGVAIHDPDAADGLLRRDAARNDEAEFGPTFIADPDPPESTPSEPPAESPKPDQTAPTPPTDAASPAAPTPPEAPKPPPTAPTNGLTSILGKDVKANGAADSIGKITDVLIDGAGNIGAAVIDVGGFLGVGSRKIAVEWRLLRFDPADSKTPIAIDMDRAALQAAPEYMASKQMVIHATDDTGATTPSPAEPLAPPPAPDSADNKPADGPK